MRRPFRAVPQASRRLVLDRYGPIKTSYSFGEMFQVIDVLRGQKEIPAYLRYLSGIPSELVPVPSARDFSDIDVALIEPSTPVELTFRGVSINRTRIQGLMRDVVGKEREPFKARNRWLRLGLMDRNEQIRREASETLLGFIHGDSEADELARAVIRETEVSRSNIPDSFRKMKALLGRPIGVLIYIFRYMPDGRPISWPAGFREDIVAAAQEANLPFFEPVRLVQEYGAAQALLADLAHYSDAFLPVMGEALTRFAESVDGRPSGGFASLEDLSLPMHDRTVIAPQHFADEP
ncbi:MAG TPA: hypothetical protein VGG10_00575 [Rhizomicrobium sp.]|jgi:hypothetical protein